VGGDRLDPGPDDAPTIGTTGALAADATALPGTRPGTPAGERDPRVARFVLTRLLGAGGMGEVYAARDPELERQVAIKLLRPGLSTSADARLRREARAMARLSHPNLITVHDVGVHEGQLFVAMELIAGQTLRSWAAGRPWRDIVQAFVVAGRGLAAAHGAGIVHRDFKPDNVLVGDDGRVAVGDFGIARTGGDEPGSEAAPADERLTQAGALIGTLRYMAPEQLARRTADARSDQFAFCVALWEVLDRDPFDRGAPPAGAEARRDAIAAGPEPGTLRGVPARIRRALVRGLAIDPAARWPELTALLDELDAATARRGRLAVPVAAGAAAIAIAAAWCLRAPPRDPCATAGDLARVWGAGDVEQLAAAFAATGRPDATDAARRVVEILDRRAAEWSALRISACRAADRGDDALTPLYRRQAACLDDQRREFAALVHRLTAQPTGEAVDRSVRTVSRVAPVAACSKMKGLTGGFPAIPAGLLHKPGLADWLAKHGKAMAPLVIWLHRHVG
jgi:eukaryotic-like serine/threonine-protein kinase